jgi:hypothetical protein
MDRNGQTPPLFVKFGVNRAEPGRGDNPHVISHPTRRFRVKLMLSPTIGGGITVNRATAYDGLS